MATRLTFSLSDYSNERTSTTLHVAEVTDANIDAQDALYDALATAVGNLTLGSFVTRYFSQGNWTLSDTPPSDPLAQRENKWLVTYADTVTGKKYNSEIGTAELGNGHLLTNSDVANLADAEWVAFISAFEDVVVAPDTGNPVIVVSARFVGRRS